MDDLHAILKADALLHADLGWLRALERCKGLMEAEQDNFCPIRRVLQGKETQMPPDLG